MTTDLGPVLTPLWQRDEPPPLDAGRPAADRRAALAALSAADVADDAADRDAAAACLSGLWLRHGFLDESHRISQDLPTPEGSYWHGLMHRREGDFGNARYWFRRAGDLPRSLGLDPVTLTDRCERARTAADRDRCRLAQEEETTALMSHCLRLARGD